MESHTPKRQAIESFVQSHREHARGWQIRVVDEQEHPVVRLEASGPNQGGSHATTLEIHTRQVTLESDQLDKSTQKMIERWLDSLRAGNGAETTT